MGSDQSNIKTSILSDLCSKLELHAKQQQRYHPPVTSFPNPQTNQPRTKTR